MKHALMRSLVQFYFVLLLVGLTSPVEAQANFFPKRPKWLSACLSYVLGKSPSEEPTSVPFTKDLIAPDSPLLIGDRIPGDSPITREEFNADAKKFLTGRPKIAASFNDAILFTGSTSASLLWLTPYGEKVPYLAPSGALLREGLVPFAGAIDDGVVGVNKHSISTEPIFVLYNALSYTGAMDSRNHAQFRALGMDVEKAPLTFGIRFPKGPGWNRQREGLI